MVSFADLYQLADTLIRVPRPGFNDGFAQARKEAEEWFHRLVIAHDHGGIVQDGDTVRINFRRCGGDCTWITQALASGRLKRTDAVVQAIARKAVAGILGHEVPPVDVWAEIADDKGRTFYRVHVQEGNAQDIG